MNNEELVFDEVISELPSRVNNIKNVINAFSETMDKMLLCSSTDTLSTLIKTNISKNVDLLMTKTQNCYKWIDKYNQELDILNNGLANNSFSDIAEFNEARNILNEDFR